jgi:uridine monophosphate synthetase
MGFFTRLEKRAKEADSLLCIGLDPHLEDLSAPNAEAIQDFCLRLIENTSDLALAYKPNIAFFEAFGTPGLSVLEGVISYIPKEIPVILDAKRGDIASSAQAYVRATFDWLGANAVTVNPYLGYDAIVPFLRDSERGVFLLCRTSNPGAREIQDRLVVNTTAESLSESGVTLYETIAELAVGWNLNDNLGLVVGATQPDALARVRKIAPELWILAPGVGAQAGDVSAVLRLGLRPDGLGLLIPVSRGISRKPDPRQAAEELHQSINLERERLSNLKMEPGEQQIVFSESMARIARDLLDTACVKFGEFRLKSGLISPIYIDLRRLIGYPDFLNRVAEAYIPILEGLSFDHLAALPYTAIPIATAISLQRGWSLIYPRKETKSYGTKADIEGVYSSGDRAVLIDDLVTTGGSKFEAIEKLKSAGLRTTDVVVLIDRQSGASKA